MDLPDTNEIDNIINKNIGVTMTNLDDIDNENKIRRFQGRKTTIVRNQARNITFSPLK